MATTQAAPAKKVARVQWEYAVLELGVQRGRAPKIEYGSELFLPGNKLVFLPASNVDSSKYKAYILNRLGSQGWELVTTAGSRGDEERYIFKRRK